MGPIEGQFFSYMNSWIEVSGFGSVLMYVVVSQE